MTAFIFRRAKQNDLEDVISLLADDELGRQREKLSKTVPSNYLDAFIKIDVDPNQFLMVVESKDIIVGTCHLTLMPSLTFQGGLRMNVEAVRVASSCRGQGVGEWMINQALSLARKEGCKIIQLTTNKERIDAKRFYEKLGFKSTHEGMKMYL
jgi:ribosomal protein S18 acetylase RimI-like enzyme